jgi:hypothetical protein
VEEGMTARSVEMLAWSGCPSHPQAQRQMRVILDDLGLTDVAIEVSWIEDDATAQQRRFVGSPTFRVDDVELIPTDAADTYALTCRLYRLADGRFSPTPDPAQLAQATAARFSR